MTKKLYNDGRAAATADLHSYGMKWCKANLRAGVRRGDHADWLNGYAAQLNG